MVMCCMLMEHMRLYDFQVTTRYKLCCGLYGTRPVRRDQSNLYPADDITLVNKGFVPVIWLTNEKTEYSYEKMVTAFQADLKRLSSRGYEPEMIMVTVVTLEILELTYRQTDMEDGLRNQLERLLPAGASERLKACWFHVMEAIQKHLRSKDKNYSSQLPILVSFLQKDSLTR